MRSLYLKSCWLVLTLFAFSDSFAQMRQLHRNQGGVTDEVSGISFYTPVEGYITLGAGDLKFTADSGRTYTYRSLWDNVDFNGNTVNLTFGFVPGGVHAFDKNNLLVYGDYGNVPAILRSTDGGLHFKLVWHDQPAVMPNYDGVQSMIFTGNGSTGYAMEQHRILKTTNKGESWQIVYRHSILSASFNNLQVPDVNTIIASGNPFTGNKVIRSTDGGQTWNGVSIPDNLSIYSICFSSSQKGWINLLSKDKGESLYKTINGGSTWTLVNDPVKDPFQSHAFYFMNDNTAFALQDGPMEVYKTIDGGSIWERVPKDNNFQYEHYPLSKLFFLNNDIFWTGGPVQQVQINTNPAGQVIPNAKFRIDTTGFSQTLQVKLQNSAGRQHKFRWFVNGSEISNAYDVTYAHEPQRGKDTIRLIAYNDAYSDTVQQIYDFPPLPFISSADPVAGGAGSVITLRGFNFRNAQQVTFGGTPATFKIISDTVIQATLTTGTTGTIVVKNYSGYGTLPGFIYLPPPRVDAFTPRTGKTGNKIVITGSHLEYVKNVLVGGLPVQSFNMISPTQLEIILGSSGDGNIEVITPGGSNALAGFTALPEIFDFTPKAATQASRVSITGSGLDNNTSITVGGKPVTQFFLHSPTLLEISVPENGSGDIVITKGAATAAKGTFIYLYKPVITSIVPAVAEPGTTIDIIGNRFNAVPSENVVSFGPVRGIVRGASTTHLTVEVPLGSVYGPLEVTSNMLTTRSAMAFDPRIAQPVAITENAFSEQLNIQPPLSTRCYDIIPGDLDGDGRTDLLMHADPQYTVDSVFALLLLNAVNGTSPDFTTTYKLKLPAYKTINIADANNDGKPDICIVTENGFVQIYENYSVPGRPDFRSSALRLTLPKSFYLFFDCLITSGDLDADGKADIIVCAASGGTAIYRNLGNPGKMNFDTTYYYHACKSPKSFSLADLDNDNKVDIITTNGTIRNLSTPGKIELAAEVIESDFLRSRQVASADLDEDGKLDVIYAGTESRNIYVQRNTSVPGNISFAASQPISSFYAMFSTITNDFDGDGKPDIATVTENGLVAIFRNAGTPGNIRFMPPQRVNNYNAENFHYPAIYTGDFNNDKKADFLIYGNTPALYLNHAKALPVIVEATPGYGVIGSEIMLHGLNFTGTTGVSFGGIAAASFKVISDTLIQAVIGNGGAGLITVTNAEGGGEYERFVFGPAPVISEVVPNTAKAGATITIRGHHFEKDISANIVLFGTLKATIVSADTNELKVIVPVSAPYQNISVTARKLTGHSPARFNCIFNGANDVINETNFAPYISFPASARYGNYADIDGDGKLDIYALEYDDKYQPTRKMFILHNTSTLDSFSFKRAGNLNDMEYAGVNTDVDGDGKPDVINLRYNPNEIWVYLNNSTPGNISFAAPVKVPHYNDANVGSHIKDYDNDGRPDVVLITQRSFNFYRNVSVPGHVAFEECRSFYYSDELTGALGDDIDGDGRPDLTTTSFATSKLVALINTSTPGNIMFREEPLVGNRVFYNSIEFKDVDGDLKPDLNLNTRLYRNLSTPGKMNIESSFYQMNAKYEHRFNDLDGDGKADLILQHGATLTNRDFYLQKNISTPGSFAFTEAYKLPTGNAFSGSFVADFNGDNKPEIAMFIETTSAESGLHIFPNITGNDVTLNNCAAAPDSIRTNIKSLTYQWQIRSGGNFINLADNAEYTGTTTSQLKMKSTPLAWSGNVYRCKTDTMYSISYTLKVNPNPVVNLGMDTFYCQKGQPVKVGSPAEEGVTYRWAHSGEWKGSFATISAQYDASYYLIATNKAGCVTTDTINVAYRRINTTPVVTLNAEMCAGGQVELAAGEGTAYQWYDNTYKPIPGAITKTFMANVIGIYYVTAVVNGCTWDPKAVFVTARAQLKAPFLMQSGTPVLESSADGTNLWYRDNVLIPGATGKKYTPDRPGAYTCRATEAGCISENSNVVVISAQPFDDEHVIAAPNPVSQTLYISYPYNTAPIDITVYDINGNRLRDKVTFTNQYELDVRALRKGMYLIHLSKPETGEIVVKKIVKL